MDNDKKIEHLEAIRVAAKELLEEMEYIEDVDIGPFEQALEKALRNYRILK